MLWAGLLLTNPISTWLMSCIAPQAPLLNDSSHGIQSVCKNKQSPFDQTTTRCKQSAKNMISLCRAREHFRCLFSADWNENTGTISLCQCAGVEDHSGGEG